MICRNIYLFKQFLSKYGRENYLELLKAIAHKYYKEHEIISFSGDIGNQLIIILKGKVAI